MAISAKVEMDTLRGELFNEILDLVVASGKYDDVMLIKSNRFCFPCIGMNGTELFCEVTVSIPKGTKSEPYDGYALAKDYAFKLSEKEQKAKERKAEAERKRKEKENA